MDLVADGPFRGAKPAAPGATARDIAAAAAALGVAFPDDYREFLRWSNGWEGMLGEAYIALDGVWQLASGNVNEFQRLYPGVVAIGGDGGLETFALDYRSGPHAQGLVAFDRNSGLDSARHLGPTFLAGIERLMHEPDGPWDDDFNALA